MTNNQPERIEYGFQATMCSCQACVRHCEQVSGFLVPEDLPRWRHYFGVSENIRLAHVLLASPGALVGNRDGHTFRINTLVPDRQQNGMCVFLNSANRCMIHPLSPFGCKFFDGHMSDLEAQTRSHTGLMAVLNDWNKRGPYSSLWHQLYELDRIAKPPEVARGLIKQGK